MLQDANKQNAKMFHINSGFYCIQENAICENVESVDIENDDYKVREINWKLSKKIIMIDN